LTENIRLSEAQTVTLSSIKPHPANARRGDIDLIAQSLAHHGQYKPIVVNRETKQILAGNHTYKAAKKLGWKSIAVVWVDADEPTSRRIMLADNRTSDLAHYDEPVLRALLEELPNLDGTGFTPDDLANLTDIIDSPFQMDMRPKRSPKDDEHRLVLGPLTAVIDPDAYDAWEEWLLEQVDESKPRAIKYIKFDLLGLPQPTPPVLKDPATLTSPPEQVTADLVPINDLRPYPANPRTGDIGAIAESLERLGQFRPIVARRGDNTILAGNHTWQAARALGWQYIAVTFVQCTDEEAARIVLVDNRTADHGTYDDKALKDLIASLPDWNGTAYTPTEVAEILGGGATKPGPDTTGKTTCRIGNLSWRAPRIDIHRWAAGKTMSDVAEMLHIPTQALTE